MHDDAPAVRSRPAEPPPRSSARDVARLAGVSTATVSRALNLPGQVDPDTLARVRQAIDKLRYVPHGAARALRSQRTQMVGAVVPSFDYALYARTTSALQHTLDERGYSLVLAAHHYDLATEVRVTEQLIRHGVDAFAFVGLDHDPALFRLLDDYGRPYVLTWGVDPSGRHPSIGFDNHAAAFAVTEHLLKLGHRRFGLLSAPLPGNDRARERGAGVRAALAARGLALDPRHVRHSAISLAAAHATMRGASICARSPVGGSSTTNTAGISGRSLLAASPGGGRTPARGVCGTDGCTTCGRAAGVMAGVTAEANTVTTGAVWPPMGAGVGSGVMSSSPN
jgi:LacI family transcriptional regulator